MKRFFLALIPCLMMTLIMTAISLATLPVHAADDATNDEPATETTQPTAPLATPPSLSRSISEKEMAKLTKGYTSLHAQKIKSLVCEGVTEVKSLSSAKAPFTFKIAKDKDMETSYCDIRFDPSEDADIQELQKFTKLLPDFCRTFKSFYFDSPILIFKAHPLKMDRYTYQDLNQKSRMVIDKKAQSIQIFHNGSDDIEVDYKKVRKWNLANRIIFNPNMEGSGAKAITDVKYHVVRGIPTPQLIDSFIHDQIGHSFSSTFTLSNCQFQKF